MPPVLGLLAAAAMGGIMTGMTAGTMAGLVAAGGTLILGGLQMLLAPHGGQNSSGTGGSIPLVDTGMGFDPVPNFSSSEAAISVTFGQSMVNGQMLQRRIYGNNQSKGFFLVGFGEAGMPALPEGLELADLWVDGLKISEMGNYSASPDDDASYYLWSGKGDKLEFTFNNTATVDSGRGDSKGCGNDYWPNIKYETIAGPIVNLFKSGRIDIYVRISQSQALNTEVSFRPYLVNYNNPADVRYCSSWTMVKLGGEHSAHGPGIGHPDWYWVSIDATEAGGGGHIDIPQSGEIYGSVIDLVGPLTFQVMLEYQVQVCAPGTFETVNGSTQVAIQKVVITDADFDDSFQVWGTAFALIHINNIQGISKDPQFTAIVKGLGREANQDEGNPALCAYQFLTGYSGPEEDASRQLTVTHNLSRSEVDWPSVEETIAFCNALKGGLGYRVNRTFGAGITTDKVLKEFTAAGRFFIIRKGGRYYFKPDRDEPLSYVLSDPGEIIPGSLQVGIGTLNVPNREEAQYLESGLAYTAQRFNVEDADDIALHGLRSETLDLGSVTDQRQAWELSNFVLNGNKLNNYWCKCKVGLKSLRFFSIGDLITIDTDNPVVAGRTWRLVSVDRENHLFGLSFSEHHPEVYTSSLLQNGQVTPEAGYELYMPWYYLPEDYSTPVQWPGGGTGPSEVYNLEVTGLAYDSAELKTVVSLEYTFDDERCDLVEFEYCLDGDTWISAGSTTGVTKIFEYPMQNGILHVRARCIWQARAGYWSELVQDIFGPVYPGFGAGQFGLQPFGH